jgi:hypothetical protein
LLFALPETNLLPSRLNGNNLITNTAKAMDFKEATDRATGACITLEDVAQALGVFEVARARMDPSNPNARPAPAGWERALARLARKRMEELARLAVALEGA